MKRVGGQRFVKETLANSSTAAKKKHAIEELAKIQKKFKVFREK